MSTEEQVAEKRKLSEGGDGEPQTKRSNVVDGPIEYLFKDFEVVKVLNENSHSKMICVEGRYSGKEDSAVVLLEKTPFDEAVARQMLNDKAEVTTGFHNDIYRAAQMYPATNLNGKIVLIFRRHSLNHGYCLLLATIRVRSITNTRVAAISRI